MSCSFAIGSSLCGSIGKESTVPLESCNIDMTSHLLSLGISSKHGWRNESSLSEKELILNRAGYFDLPNERAALMVICPKHRRKLTVDWSGRKSTSCCYPMHKGRRKQLKSQQRVNFMMSKEIFTLHKVVVPVGSGKRCVKVVYNVHSRTVIYIFFSGSVYNTSLTIFL